MLTTVYEWTRKQFERDAIGEEWREIPEDMEVRYITEDWRDEKCGAFERDFWLGIGATFDVEYDSYGDPEYVCSVSPDRLHCFEETFEEHFIDTSNIGAHETVTLVESQYMRFFPVLENTEEHVVIQFGDETKANYDLITGKWEAVGEED